ncbi:MAG TPA: Rid family hydrolase [Gaiellaceae bacterium]|nr:Rid family hydrolase [Gaiellaceae bacterium]
MSEAFDSNAAPPKAGPYSHAVRTGDVVFLSGQGPFDPATGAIPGPFDEQVRQTLRNLAAAAGAAGGTLADAVRVGVYLRDMANFPVLNEVYAEFFHEPYPARTTTQSGIRIEVEIDAVLEVRR